MSDEVAAMAVLTLVRTGKPPSAHQGLIGGTTLLMFGREAIRDPMTVVFAPMTMSMVASGDMTMKQALSGSKSPFGGGAFPMSMTEAAASSRGLQEVAQGKKPTEGTKRGRKELKRRQMALARKWLTTEMKAEKKVFKTAGEVQSFIAKKIRSYYGLASKDVK